MTQLNFHHLFAGLTAATLGGGALALAAHSTPTPQESSGLATEFTRADQNVFSSYEGENGACEAGFAPRGLCFSRSPLEAEIVVGERFPDDMYPLALEWRANLAMTRKAAHLKTIRIGRTVALVNRETRMVADAIRLGGGETDHAANGRTG